MPPQQPLRSFPDAADRIAAFLADYADAIEAAADTVVEMAARETGLAVSPRLRDMELPRTTNQLRQGAHAARDRSWCLATIDTKTNIRSCYSSLAGPVAVFGPNNFPFAFNSIAGGDFVAAVAAGNPVIGKANTGHPGTTRLLAELALAGGATPRPSSRIPSAPLSDAARRRIQAGVTPQDRSDRIHGQQVRRPATEGRRRRRRNANLPGDVERQPGLHPAGRARGARRRDRARAVRFLRARGGPVLHPPGDHDRSRRWRGEIPRRARGTFRKESSRDFAGGVGHPGHRPGAQCAPRPRRRAGDRRTCRRGWAVQFCEYAAPHDRGGLCPKPPCDADRSVRDRQHCRRLRRCSANDRDRRGIGREFDGLPLQRRERR